MSTPPTRSDRPPGTAPTAPLTDAADVDGGPVAELVAGARVGRYIVLSRLGAGGVGMVYAAFDPELDRKVALKVLRSTGGGAQLRLMREAQAMARLSHPNVLAIHDVGPLDDGVFLAVELVDGGTLRQWLAARRRTPDEIVELFAAAGRGLEAAHRAGLVHRDFKPDNVLVGRDGRVRVTDFGLVRAVSDGAEPEPVPVPEPELETLAATTADDRAAPSAPVTAAPAPPTAPPTPRPTPTPALRTPITRVGAVMGTPGYMAPEQYRAAPVDARTDQFAFCASLYEALYGERPFAGRTPDESAARTLHAEAKPPSDARVPAHLRRLVLRGLAKDPAARFPDMAALLDALVVAPARRRRRLIVAALAFVVAGAIAASIRLAPARPDRALCRGAAARLAGVWDDSVEQKIRDAFRRAPLPDGAGERAFASLRPLIGTYADAWVAMHTETCEATRVRGDQPEATMALRMGCLDARLRELRTLTALFADGAAADAGLVRRSAEATAALTPLAGCADVEALRAPLPLPAAPSTRDAVAAARGRLAETHALFAAGRYQPALATATAVVTDARALAYPPLLAEALLVRGELLAATGEHAAAEEVLLDALAAAVEARHERVLAEGAARLVFLTGYWLGRRADGYRWAKIARGALARLGEGADATRAEVLRAEAIVHGEAGEGDRSYALAEEAVRAGERAFKTNGVRLVQLYTTLGAAAHVAHKQPEARRAYERALELAEKSLGGDHELVASALSGLGNVALSDKRVDDALSAYRRAVALAERAVGPDHPETANYLTNLAEAEREARHFEPARAGFARAISVYEKKLGREHPSLIEPLAGLADVLLSLGRAAEAVVPAERAATIARADGTAPSTRADAELTLARALLATKPTPPSVAARARTLAASAKSLFEKAGAPEDAARAAALLR